MHGLVLTFIFICLTFTGFARFLVEGVILDENEIPIADVTINENGTNNATYSSADGTFYLFCSVDNGQLIFTHPSFLSLKVPIDSSGKMKIFMVRLSDGNTYNLNHLAGFTDFKMKNPNKHLGNMPYLLGEADINRQLQMLPGVEFGSEGFSNLLVRGGNVDENLMLYNGTPVYNYNHLFGISSLFNTNGIDNVKLSKGINATQYGGRLSSVIQLETAKTAEYSGLTGELEVSPLSAGLYLRSIKKGDHYFTLSFRRTYFDLLLPIETRQNDLNANFYDLQLNYGKTLKNGDQIEYSFLSTQDNYLVRLQATTDTTNIGYKLTYNWRNALASVKYTQAFNRRLKAEHSIHYSGFKSDQGFQQQILNSINGVPTASENITSGIREYIAQSNFNYIKSNSETIAYGLQAHAKTYRTLYTHFLSLNYPGYDDADEYIGDKAYKPAFEIVGYGEYKKRPSASFEYILGLRNTLYINGTYKALFPEPRAHLYFGLDKWSVLKLGYSRNNQFVKLINIGGSGDPSNYWVPATELVKPQSSDVFEAAYERRLGKEYSLSINTYFKQLNNIQVVENFLDALNPENSWENFVAIGSGQTYGAEFMLQKNEGIFTGWLSYTFSRAYRSFPDLDVEPFLFDFDRTHMLKLYANVELGDYWDLGFNFVIGSGQLFSIPTGKYYDLDGNLQLEYTSINNYRSPIYQRFDISILKMNEDSYLDQTWKFYMYNLFDARNPLLINGVFENSSFTNMSIVRTYLRPVPGIAYILKF